MMVVSTNKICCKFKIVWSSILGVIKEFTSYPFKQFINNSKELTLTNQNKSLFCA